MTPSQSQARRRVWKALLRLQGRTQQGIAHELGVHVTYVNKVITGERASARIREALAAEVGLSVDEAWGEMAQAHLEEQLHHKLRLQALTRAQAAFVDAVQSGGASATRAA